MAVRSKLDLVKAVMIEGGWLAAGETPLADDSLIIENAYDERIGELRTDGLASWPADEIPLDVFRALVKLMANVMAPAFGKTYDPAVEEYCRRMMRRVTAKRRSGDPTPMQSI